MFIRFCFSYNFLLNFEVHITFTCIGAAYLLLHNIVPILYSSTIFLGTYIISVLVDDVSNHAHVMGVYFSAMDPDN